MYAGITLCCLGLAGMLWANSRGWSPDPRRVFWTAAAVVAVVVYITPVGTSDVASYAAYGRIAALGHNPYMFLPADLPGGVHNPYTALVGIQWVRTPSVYGPVATWTHLAAALVGGSRPWLTIWVLMIMTGIAFLAAGYLLLRSAANPVRAGLIWAANPLLIYLLVMSGHLDTFLALAGIAAILISRRGATVWHDLAVGLVIGVAGGIKINAAFVALGIAVPLIRERAWVRLLRTGAFAAVATFGLYFFSYGLDALKPLPKASRWVIAPSVWRLVQMTSHHFYLGSPSATSTLIGVLWPPLMLALAWYLYNRLSPDVPAVLAATCALTFAWVLVAPWSLPWYTALAWVTLALLPRNSLTRWLTLATCVLALLHFNAGHPTNHAGRSGPVAMRPEPEQYRAWADAAARALQRWYNPRTGLWKTTGWWNCANALTALIQHSQRTGERRYRYVIETTFGRAQRVNPEFSNEYYDDDGWWALAWIAAFDLIGDEKYLDLARKLFAGMAAGWDDTCGGGCGGRAGKPTRTRYRTNCSCSPRAACISARPIPAAAPAVISTGRCASGGGSTPAG